MAIDAPLVASQTLVDAFVATKIGANPSVSSLAESNGFIGTGTTCP